MAKSYYKQSERDEVEGINWGKIGTDLSEKLNTEQTRREDLKTQIDTEANDYVGRFNDMPQGINQGANQRMANFAEEASGFMLSLNKRLKSGDIKLRDYNAQKANLEQSTTDMFQVAKAWNKDWDETLRKTSTGEAGSMQTYNNKQLQKFIDPSTSGIYIDEETGFAVSAEMDENGEPSRDPNKRSSIFSTKAKQTQDIPPFKIGEWAEIELARYKNDYKVLSDEKNVDAIKSLLKSEAFLSSKEKIIASALEGTYTTQSILMDSTKNKYEFSQNKDDFGKEGIMYVIPDPNNPSSGVLIPQPTDDQEKEAAKILDERLNSMLGYEEIASKVSDEQSEIANEKARLDIKSTKARIRQTEAKHKADLRKAKTAEEKDKIELEHLPIKLKNEESLRLAQLKVLKDGSQWQSKSKEEKSVLSNFVSKVGNMYSGTEQEVDEAISYIKSINQNIKGVERNDDGVEFSIEDDNGRLVTSFISKSSQTGFTESVSALVGSKFDVIEAMENLEFDNSKPYTKYDSKSSANTSTPNLAAERDVWVEDGIPLSMFEGGSFRKNKKMIKEFSDGIISKYSGLINLRSDINGDDVTFRLMGSDATVTVDTDAFGVLGDAKGERKKLMDFIKAITDNNLEGLNDRGVFKKKSKSVAKKDDVVEGKETKKLGYKAWKKKNPKGNLAEFTKYFNS